MDCSERYDKIGDNNRDIKQVKNPFSSIIWYPTTLSISMFLYSIQTQNNIINMISDPDHYTLYRKLRVGVKNDDDLFRIRYTLTDDHHAEDSFPKQSETRERIAKIIKPVVDRNTQHTMKHRKGSEEPLQKAKAKAKHKREYKKEHQQREEKTEEVDRSEDNSQTVQQERGKQVHKYQQKYAMLQKLVDDDSDALQGLEELQLKNKRSKSSELKQAFEEMQLARASQLTIKNPRQLYDEYIELPLIQQSRANGEKIYYRGIVQFSDTVKWYCTIQSSELQGVLVVQGRNTNRALHEDQVYFTVVGQQKQKVLCKVAAIASRRMREVVGKIQFHKSKQIYLLKPTNAKFASMNIDLAQIDKQWLQHACTKYFLAEFDYWDTTDDYPFCKIKGEYGTFGQVEIETQALLKTYSIEEPHYTQEDIQSFIAPFKANINARGEFVPPAEQIKKRKDFRKWRTFIVQGSEFDAAYSIFPVSVRGKADPNFLRKNLFQVNVHFTDVPYFVREGSAVDGEAKKRVVGYNLVHRAISLLPEPFSSSFCALGLNKESLTISISFQIDEEGNIQETSKVARSIIAPPFAFNYQQLQRVLSGKVEAEEWRAWNCGCRMQSQFKAISADVRLLNQLISKRRQKRIDTGALIFQIPVKSFKLQQNLTPTHFELKAKSDAHYMVEECAITASTKVAQFLLKNLKGRTILYRHRFPGFKKLAKFKQSLKKAGQSLPQNQKQIQKFINQMVTGGQLKQCLRDVIKYQTVKLLQNFDYFQALGSDPATWVHYAINIPLYTHCSTATKYYGDLLVLRQLAAVIENVPWTATQGQMAALLQNCTRGKLIAQHIRTGCEKIFLCLYLRDNPVFTNAVLTDVEEWGLKICIPKFNFKTMIKFKHLKSIKAGKVATDENLRKFVRLDFASETDNFKTKLVLKEMQEINLQIRSADTYPLDYGFSIVLPHPTDPAQKILIS